MTKTERIIVSIYTGLVGVTSAYALAYMIHRDTTHRYDKHGAPDANGLLPYVQGCRDTERRMQREAVDYGCAYFEGDDGEFFRWQHLKQRFPTIK